MKFALTFIASIVLLASSATAGINISSIEGALTSDFNAATSDIASVGTAAATAVASGYGAGTAAAASVASSVGSEVNSVASSVASAAASAASAATAPTGNAAVKDGPALIAMMFGVAAAGAAVAWA